MEKLYERINFENAPSTKTPLNEENLNKIDGAIDELDNRIIEVDSKIAGATKAEVTNEDVMEAFNEYITADSVIWKQGTVSNGKLSSVSDAISSDYIRVKKGWVLNFETECTMRVSYFDKNFVYVSDTGTYRKMSSYTVPNDGFVRICISFGTGITTAPDDGNSDNIKFFVPAANRFVELENHVEGIMAGQQIILSDRDEWRKGMYDFDTSVNVDDRRISNVYIRLLKKGTSLSVKTNGLYVRVCFYGKTGERFTLLKETAFNNLDFVVTEEEDIYFAVVCATGPSWTASSAITVDDMKSEFTIIYSDSVEYKPSTFSYIGSKIPSKVNYFDSVKLFTMSGSGITSQDTEIYGNYYFVAFSGSERIRVYSLANNSLVADMTISVHHGSGMQFSNEFFETGDEFPLLYVGGYSNNRINVVRIKNTNGTWSANIVRTIYIPTTHGYWFAPSVDAKSNILYAYGYTANSYLESGNSMKLLRMDLNNLTENEDGTCTPELISECETPYLGVTQGRKFYGGNLYVAFAHTEEPHNARLVCVDGNSGVVKADIDLTGVTTSEAEGLCYRVDGNNIYWYLNDFWDVFKLTF